MTNELQPRVIIMLRCIENTGKNNEETLEMLDDICACMLDGGWVKAKRELCDRGHKALVNAIEQATREDTED